MVRKTILKSALKEIKLTNKRFISLIFIITLGISFIIGIKNVSNDMKKTAENYYKETNLMDLKIKSSLGFERSDANALKEIKNIKGVMLTKTLYTKANSKEEEFTLKINSINKDRSKNNDNYINRLILTSGRYPSTINEGLVEEKFLKDKNLKIGDLVLLNPEDKNILKAKKIKIVGTIKSSYYTNNKNNENNLDNEKFDYYMYIDENDFNFYYYNEVYLTLKNTSNYSTFSKEYKNYINSNKEEVLNVTSSINKEKYENNINEIKSKINLTEESLNELYSSEIPKELLGETIKELSEELNDYKEELKKTPSSNVFVLSRNEIPSFYKYKLEIEKLENIFKLLPLVFLVISLLIVVASIIKMIYEEKKEIGILKAFGYNNFNVCFKYLLYLFLASILGSLFAVVFSKCISLTILIFYSKVYKMPNLMTSFKINDLVFASLFISLISILIIVLFIKYSNNFIESLNYEKNILKHRKKIIFAVASICGYSIILITLLGIKDSANEVLNKQFKNIIKYDMTIGLDSTVTEENLNTLQNNIIKDKNINQLIKINRLSINLKNENKNEIATLIIPDDENKINNFISLKNNAKKLELKNNGVIISEKLSKLLNIKKNDIISITLNNKVYKVKVSNVTENYINNFVYMTNNMYEKITAQKTSYNLILTKNEKITENQKKKLKEKIINNDYILSCSFSSDVKEEYKKSLSSFNDVIFILILFPLSLAVMVFYNIYNMDKSERKKEISLLKSLGFYDLEIIKRINKENVILSLMGSLFGIIIGSILTFLIINKASILIFDFKITFISYLLVFLINMLFVFISSLFLQFNIKKLDFINALKNN